MFPGVCCLSVTRFRCANMVERIEVLLASAQGLDSWRFDAAFAKLLWPLVD